MLKSRVERLESDLDLEDEGRRERDDRIGHAHQDVRNMDALIGRFNSVNRRELTREENRKLSWEIEKCKNRIEESRGVIQREKAWISDSIERTKRLEINLNRACRELDDELARHRLANYFVRLEKLNSARMEKLEIHSENDNLYQRTELPVSESSIQAAWLKKWRTFQTYERKSHFFLWEMNRFKREQSEEGEYIGKIPSERAVKIFEDLVVNYEKNYKKGDDLRKDIFKNLKKDPHGNKDGGWAGSDTSYVAWLGKNGRDTLIARFVSLDDNRVTLELLSGTTRRYPLDKFWVEEQNIFHQLENSK